MSLARATLTLLAGGALAQLVPLLLGPAIARLFTPEAMGVFTQFATIAAALGVAASLRYEQALPLAQGEDEARALLALALALAAAAAALTLPALLTLAMVTAGVLQALMLWANRARRFGALAASRVVQYGGAAVLQLALGWALWRGAAAGREGAWALALAPLAAQALACAWLLRPAPAGGWRAPRGRPARSVPASRPAPRPRTFRAPRVPRHAACATPRHPRSGPRASRRPQSARRRH